ncbi:MAG: glycosyltransferase family 2 protein, partial [Moorea sp. SIO4G2]|nr:glycosyltransferase family 2 protein [Moorena sp. SIO4G2]
GVTSAIALWHQRNRWAEGGYQRYLDYWRLIVSNRLGLRKTIDLFTYLIIQYFLPTAAVPDCLMAIARNRLPIFSPITGLTVTVSVIGMFVGLRRTNQNRRLRVSNLLVPLLQTLRGNLYLLHWMLVMAATTARMSVRPKRLKWVKTVHRGGSEE